MTCPSWAAGASRSVQRLPSPLVDALALVSSQLSYLLLGSVFLASLAPPVAAVGLVLLVLQSGCDGNTAIQATARQAAFGCEVILVIGTIAVGLAAASVVAIPEAVLLGSVLAGVAALRTVLTPLGAGRSPSLGALSSLATSAAGLSGDDDVKGAASWLGAAVGAADSNQKLLPTNVRDAARKKGAPVATDPQFPLMISFTLGSSSVPDRLAQLYSHHYQAAAEETYALDPSTDLRPWLAGQIRADLGFLRAAFPAAVIRAPQTAKNIGEARDELANWQSAVAAVPSGPWSRETVRRVLRSRSLQTNLPIVEPQEDREPERESSGSGKGLLAAAGVALAALLAFK